MIMDENLIDYDRYVDYKEMYLKMVRASKGAMDVLIETQRECEEMYMNAVDQRLTDLGITFPWETE